MQKWLFYDLLLSAAPAILVAFAFWLIGKPKVLEILGDGQLFFFCTALAGTTFGALSEANERISAADKGLVQPSQAALMFLILFASFAFGTATLAAPDAKPRIAATSFWLSLGTIMLVGSIRIQFNAW